MNKQTIINYDIPERSYIIYGRSKSTSQRSLYNNFQTNLFKHTLN